MGGLSLKKTQITNPLTTIGPCTIIEECNALFSNRYVGHDEHGYGVGDNHGDTIGQ